MLLQCCSLQCSTTIMDFILSTDTPPGGGNSFSSTLEAINAVSNAVDALASIQSRSGDSGSRRWGYFVEHLLISLKYNNKFWNSSNIFACVFLTLSLYPFLLSALLWVPGLICNSEINYQFKKKHIKLYSLTNSLLICVASKTSSRGKG